MSHESTEENPRALVASWSQGLYVVADLFAWILALSAASATRYDLAVADINRWGLTAAIGIALAVHLVAFAVLRTRYRYATMDETVGLALTVLGVTVVLVTTSALTQPRILPMSVAMVAPAAALSFMLVIRWIYLRIVRYRRRPRADVRRTLVLGSGEGGQQAIGMMLADPDSPFVPVGVLDDDPAKRYQRTSGVRVLGRFSDIADVAATTDAGVALLAAPSMSPQQMDRAVRLVRDAGLELRVMPSATEILSTAPRRAAGAVTLPQVTFRELEIQDLLHRNPAETDVEEIAGYLDGAVILVTGAGGSIGSQLCKEISRFSPARLVMTDRDDSSLHALQLALDGRAMLDSEDLVLGDLRTPGFISELIRTVRPDIVFHTAALKHLPLVERFPGEAFLTNVAATAELLETCADHDVRRFVHISTDKAADPESVLGYTKRVSERLTATLGRRLGPDHQYISVRFGNVLGSRGSVLTTFSRQLEAGLPLTITSPDMTRFFMSAHEACQLVLQAAAIGRVGEVLVLDMGEPHRVEDIARRFAALRGHRDLTVAYSHPRPGEKIVEKRLGEAEEDVRPVHPLITHVEVPELSETHLAQIAQWRAWLNDGGSPSALTRWMHDAAVAGTAAAERSVGVMGPSAGAAGEELEASMPPTVMTPEGESR